MREYMTELNIIDAIGRRVVLEQRGGGYWGVCPFHRQEKKLTMTTTMLVSRESKTFHCFDCKAEGSAEEFVKRFDDIEEHLIEV
jgi:DNA primase